MAETVAWEALPKQGAPEQQQPSNSQHSGSIASAVTTKSDQAASPLVAGNSVHSSPCLEPRARQDQLPPVDSGASRVVTALHNMLARGLDSDYVEGLRPVLQDGRLQISTFIKLSDSSEPVCIGLYPNLPAAVQAQKQSQQLVGSLPPGLARQLIEAQLQHSAQQQQQQQGQQQQGQQPQAPAAAVHQSSPANPSRWLSNTSDATSGLPPCEPGRPTPLAAAGDHDHDDLTPHAAQQEAGTAQRQQLWLSHTQPPGDATGAPAPASPAAAAGAASLAALTDDVINLLLRKGLYALAAVQHRDSDEGSEPVVQKQQARPGVGPAGAGLPAPGSSVAAAAAAAAAAARSGLVQQQPYAPPQLQNDYSGPPMAQHSGYGAFGERDCSGYAAAAAAPDGGLPGPRHTHMGAPAGPGLQHMGGCGMGPLGAAAMTAPGPAAPAAADYMAALTAEYPVATSHQMYAAAQQQPAYPGLSPQQYGYATAQYGASAAQYAAAAQMAAGPYGRAFNGGAGGDMFMYHQPQPQPVVVPPKQPQQPRLDISKLQEPTWGMAAVPKRTYQPPPLPSYGGLGAAPPGAQDASELAAAAAAADQHQPRGLPDAGSGDWGDANDRKRGRSDPRLNCIKSVQYRVSRFPSELHELCVEHWERTRCARVVCNAVTGVMSVQGGRCVVSFNQGGQEVLKGVADYLRFAGEDRIKKWRRHVRMVDFPRPNNRTGELMTAEEFLCIVGYQSEQGGGKRGRYSADCSE